MSCYCSLQQKFVSGMQNRHQARDLVNYVIIWHHFCDQYHWYKCQSHFFTYYIRKKFTLEGLKGQCSRSKRRLDIFIKNDLFCWSIVIRLRNKLDLINYPHFPICLICPQLSLLVILCWATGAVRKISKRCSNSFKQLFV